MTDVRFQELAAYFSSPQHHATRIDPRTLQNARADVSPETQRLLQDFAVNPDVYASVGNVEVEGFVNDKQVTLRDLYALARGSSYAGADNSKPRDTVYAAIARAEAQINRIANASPTLSIGANTYVVDDGVVYQRNATGVSMLEHSDHVDALLDYRGVLVVKSEGKLFAWGGEHGWIALAVRVKQATTNGRDLITLDEEGGVWKFEGSNTEPLTVAERTHPNGKGLSTNPFAMDGAREVRTSDTGLRGIASLEKERSGAIVAVGTDGTRRALLQSW